MVESNTLPDHYNDIDKIYDEIWSRLRIGKKDRNSEFHQCYVASSVSFKEALSDDFKIYTKNVIANAKILSESLTDKGFKIFSGGTDTHLMLLDLRSFKVTGKDAQASLGRANITCNKNGIPFDTESPFITSGIRLGTPACTTRGFGEQEFKLIAELIYKVIKNLSENKTDNSKIENEVKQQVINLCSSFPIYDN